MADIIARLSATITGQVQGVGFRYSTQKYAEDLGLAGWVRNLPDGSVAVWAEGPQSNLEKLYQWLRHGPSVAHVQNIEAEWGVGATPHILPHFEVRY